MTRNSKEISSFPDWIFTPSCFGQVVTPRNLDGALAGFFECVVGQTREPIFGVTLQCFKRRYCSLWVREDFNQPIKALVLSQLCWGRRLNFFAANPSPQLFDVNAATDRFVHAMVKNEVISQDKPEKLLVCILWSQVTAMPEIESVPVRAYIPGPQRISKDSKHLTVLGAFGVLAAIISPRIIEYFAPNDFERPSRAFKWICVGEVRFRHFAFEPIP